MKENDTNLNAESSTDSIVSQSHSNVVEHVTDQLIKSINIVEKDNNTPDSIDERLKTCPENDIQSENNNDKSHCDDQINTEESAISLPDTFDVKTGEEDENILFEHRAKLFRFEKELKKWEEHGIGDMKLLINKDDLNKVRLVMRREEYLDLCCNQWLLKDTKFTPMKGSTNALTWFGQDFSEYELQAEMMAIRFKTAEICQEFHTAVLDAQQQMNDETRIIENLNTV